MTVTAAVAVSLVLGLLTVPAGAAGDDDDVLNCGDPGTSPNMPIDPANDPNNLDHDDDGIGCEDDDDGDDAPAAQPAPAVEGQPDFTG
jgi:hypothetical protein